MAVIDQTVTENYALYHADCMDVLAELPAGSIHHSVFSPPFVDLFCYSDSDRDLGNIPDYGQFFAQIERLGRLMAPAMMPGRIVAVHCMDLPITKERDGVIGIRDFPGDLIRAFVASGFIYHGRVTIWKDPLIAAVRTKAIGLMHKQLVKDSALSRPGIADYLLMFRAPGSNPVPIPHPDGLTKYAGAEDPGGVGIKRSHHVWRAYASPVWMDIRQTNVLGFREARDEPRRRALGNGEAERRDPNQKPQAQGRATQWHGGARRRRIGLYAGNDRTGAPGGPRGTAGRDPERLMA